MKTPPSHCASIPSAQSSGGLAIHISTNLKAPGKRLQELSEAICAWDDGNGIAAADRDTSENVLGHIYAPLDQNTSCVRLLRLITGEDALIECTLHVYHLTVVPPFFALSYAWGPASPSRNIILNGQAFTIRENLWTALQSLKNAELTIQDWRGQRDILFWIDAVCIDQNNMDERNHQVSMMGEIYERASTVLVWLGSAAQDSDLAITHILSHGQPLFDPRVRNAMLQLLARPYWKRMWIVQEFLLARGVLIYCGDECFQWEDIYDTLDYHRERGGLLDEDELTKEYAEQSPALRLVLGRWSFLQERQSTQRGPWQKLDDLIIRWGGQECQEIHDKVFALLGLLPKEFLWERGGIRPDYRQTVEQLCLDVLYAAQYTKDIPGLMKTLDLVMRVLGVDQASEDIENARRELMETGRLIKRDNAKGKVG